MEGIAEYPPLQPIDVMPIHSGGVMFAQGGWFACAHPERPRDGDVLYDWRCSGCVLGAAAHLIQQGDTTMTWFSAVGADPREVRISWMIERARYWGTI